MYQASSLEPQFRRAHRRDSGFFVMQSPKFLLNSHEAQFTATLSQYIAAPVLGHSFFRSYGASLPSSLTMVISRALGFSPHPPVSVYGTVIVRTPYEVFLGSVIGPLRDLAITRTRFST